jgi:DNA-binding transcriptional MerR regulator
MSTSRGLTIAEVAERTGLTPDTLRYYEKDGLMVHPVARDVSGHRRYADNDLDWIVMVTRLRSTGLPIRDVRRYAELVRQGEGTDLARIELLRAHRQTVLARLAEEQQHLRAIECKIDLYEARLADKAQALPASA